MLEAIEAVAIRDGWTMSSAGLGRFLRELFGERPEPWHELGARADQPNVVTVTSASVELPSGLGTMESVALDDPEVEARLKKTVELRPAPRPEPALEDPEHATTVEEDVSDPDDPSRPTGKTRKLAPVRVDAVALASAAARKASSTLPRPTSEPRPARPSEPRLAAVIARPTSEPPVPAPAARPASEPRTREPRETGPGIEVEPVAGDTAQRLPVASDTPAAAAAEASLFDTATSLPVAPTTTTLQGMPAVATPPRKRTGYTAPPLTAGPSLRAFDDDAAAVAASASASGAGDAGA